MEKEKGKKTLEPTSGNLQDTSNYLLSILLSPFVHVILGDIYVKREYGRYLHSSCLKIAFLLRLEALKKEGFGMNIGIEQCSIMLKPVRVYVILTLTNKIECGQPPRFSAHTVLECGLCWELGWYRRWLLEYFHVEISTVRACCGL